MALERLEESADFLIVLKAAVSFYMSHLQERAAACREETKGLLSKSKQVDEMASYGSRVEKEVTTLKEVRGEIERELEPLKPFLGVIDKITEHGRRIRENEKKIADQEQVVRERKQDVARSPEDKEAEENLREVESYFRLEKVNIDMEILRLTDAREWELRRLKELHAAPDVITAQAENIQRRLKALDETILQKESTVKYMMASLRRSSEELERLKELDRELRRAERDLEILVVVAKVLSEVSLDAKALSQSRTEPVGARQYATR